MIITENELALDWIISSVGLSYKGILAKGQTLTHSSSSQNCSGKEKCINNLHRCNGS